MSQEVRRLLNLILFWALEKAEFHTRELCWKYGGTRADGKVRVCEKSRWHTDSHAFNWTEGNLW